MKIGGPLDLFIENGPELMLLLAAFYIKGLAQGGTRGEGALGGDGNGQTKICTYHSVASIEILVCSPELDSDRLCSAWLSWTQFCSA